MFGHFIVMIRILQVSVIEQVRRRLKMDVAGLSMKLAQNQVKSDASLAMMRNVKDMMNEQGQQLVDMLSQSTTATPHPTLGQHIDISK